MGGDGRIVVFVVIEPFIASLRLRVIVAVETCFVRREASFETKCHGGSVWSLQRINMIKEVLGCMWLIVRSRESDRDMETDTKSLGIFLRSLIGAHFFPLSIVATSRSIVFSLYGPCFLRRC
jgi:hypothetical protein